MQVSRGNILKTIGMLCNPKFISKNNQYFDLTSIYFLYLLTSLPKMKNLEMPASIEHILLNWTTQEQILPTLLETFKISPKLTNAPKTLRDLAVQYRNKKNVIDKEEQNSDRPKENNSKFQAFPNSFLADVLIFTAVLITLIIMLIIIYVLYGQSKLKALVTNIALQRIKAVEAADMSDMLCTCKTQWYIMGMLIIITLGMLYLVTNKIRKTGFCKG